MLRGFVTLLYAVTATWLTGAADVPNRWTSRPPPGDAAGVLRSSPVRPLPFFYDLYTFRGDTGTTAVIAAFAVPVDRLEHEEEHGETRYRFDVSLVLADTALGSVSRSDDSVYVSLPDPLDGDHLLHTFVELQAPPSRTTLQRVIMTDATTPGIGQLYGSAYPIPDYSGEELMLSDIALGLPDTEGGWSRGAATLALLPTSQFPGGTFDVYYEAYNLPDGHPYTTDVSIEPVPVLGQEGSGARRTARTRFTDNARQSENGAVEELRRMEAPLERGSYRLTVTVTDEQTGATASRTRPLRVREWDEGATLVPACPAGREKRRECHPTGVRAGTGARGTVTHR
jgi:hypothetical protein